MSSIIFIINGAPEQISTCIPVSFRFIRQDKNKGGILFHNLRLRNQRKRKYGSVETRGQLCNRKSIHDKPFKVEQRSRFGDLEIDTIVSKNHQQSLVSIVDWKVGYLWLKKCSSCKAEKICQTTISLLESTAQALEIDWYFADPYSSWQRGTNENTNGLISQYIRKIVI